MLSVLLRFFIIILLNFFVVFLNSDDAQSLHSAESSATETTKPFTAVPIASFDRPWAMAFLPDNTLLISEKIGRLKHFNPRTKKVRIIYGTPNIDYGGQGGLGDIILHPNFSQNKLVYLSYVEAGKNNTRGAVVIVAKLNLENTEKATLTNRTVIWRQVPKTTGWGHYSHRLLVSPDKQYLFISSGERQKFKPAQDRTNNLGSIIRLRLDGSIPQDNPFFNEGTIQKQLWTYGHRNVLGLAFDSKGQLWCNEMGPRGGDELNKIVAGANYGWPIVSDGIHYNGADIPNHSTRREFHAPAISWVPSISPSGLIIYKGNQFPSWQGNAIMGGLSSMALIRVAIKNDKGYEVGRYAMNARIREVEQDDAGGIWLLEDGTNGRLLKLIPK